MTPRQLKEYADTAVSKRSSYLAFICGSWAHSLLMKKKNFFDENSELGLWWVLGWIASETALEAQKNALK